MRNDVVQADLKYIDGCLGDWKSKFEGQTILITGCAGFLGFYLTQYLVRYSCDLGIKKIIALDSFLLAKPDWLESLVGEFGDVLTVRAFDISRDDLHSVNGAVDANFVIHGASIASPTFYRKYPVETIDANIWGLRRILDVFKEQEHMRGLLFFSSSEIYGDPDFSHIPTDEEYRGNVACAGPRACYDESKRFGEAMCWIYAQQYGTPITIARPFNNYGPGMRLGDKRLPADFAQAVIDNRDLTILSDGTPTRTFCYVADAVVGYLLCLLYGKYDYFNIGIDRPEIMVRNLAEIYCATGREIFGYSGRVNYQKSDDPDYLKDNPNRRCPVISKAKNLLGYNPTILVEDGVDRYLRFLQQELSS
jgi:UDP-glucuronate decarboxylase